MQLLQEKFINQSQFINHRKKHHQQSVPTCRNYVNGSCLYTNENCWFKYDSSEGNEENENSNNKSEDIENNGGENGSINGEVIQKNFKIMENLMAQMTQMKEKNQLL